MNTMTKFFVLLLVVIPNVVLSTELPIRYMTLDSEGVSKVKVLDPEEPTYISLKLVSCLYWPILFGTDKKEVFIASVYANNNSYETTWVENAKIETVLKVNVRSNSGSSLAVSCALK